MARKEKPVKIIRYGNSHGGRSYTIAKVKKILSVVIIALLIVGAGFLRMKFVTKAVENKKDEPVSSESAQSRAEPSRSKATRGKSSSQTKENSATSEATSSSDEEDSSQAQVSKTRIYYYADVKTLTTARGIDAAINSAKALGANCIVFDAKDSTGYIHWNSANTYASQLKADSIVDISALVSECSKNGITPVARVYAFMDQMISTVERTTAIMYQGTQTRWIDSSRALGGKSWANPASEIMQNYLKDLTDELLADGIKEIIYAGFSTPTGYSLDKCDYGTTKDAVLAEMQSLVKTLKAKVSAKGGYSAWQIEYSAVAADGSYAQYIVHPYQLGAENIIITADAGADVLTTAQAVADTKDDSITSLALWISGTDCKDAASIITNYFVN